MEFWLLFANVSSLAPVLLELVSEPETVLLALVIMRTMPTPLNTTTMHASIVIAIAVTGCLRGLPGSWAPFVAVAFFVDLPMERFAAAGLDPFSPALSLALLRFFLRFPLPFPLPWSPESLAYAPALYESLPY